MIAAHKLADDFTEHLYAYLQLRGFLGVRPECMFYIRPELDTAYLEVFFLKEKWHYEMGHPFEAIPKLLDLSIKVGENLEKWINDIYM